MSKPTIRVKELRSLIQNVAGSSLDDHQLMFHKPGKTEGDLCYPVTHVELRYQDGVGQCVLMSLGMKMARDIMDDGGPWFPQTNDAWISTGTNPPVPCGASVRQVLAMSAMEVLIGVCSDELSGRRLAEQAFRIADAMLVEGAKRDKTESKGG